MQFSFIMLLRVAMIVTTVVSGGPAAKKAPKKNIRDLELSLVCLALYLCVEPHLGTHSSKNSAHRYTYRFVLCTYSIVLTRQCPSAHPPEGEVVRISCSLFNAQSYMRLL